VRANNPKESGGPFGPPLLRAGSFFPALLLERENPDNAALGNVILQTDVVGGQRILDRLRVNTVA